MIKSISSSELPNPYSNDDYLTFAEILNKIITIQNVKLSIRILPRYTNLH